LRAGNAIGKNGKSAPALLEALARGFRPTKINEAIQRLVDRRYVVPASPASAAQSPPWASLGLPPDVAGKNFEDCRVRVRSIDVEGARELTAALQELGVRVVRKSMT
jgi:ribosomal protein S12 methylthiotransferase accessory factor